LLRLLLRLLLLLNPPDVEEFHELAAGVAPPFGFGAILLVAAFGERLRIMISFRG
jgi:hypothetical protein